MRGFSGGHSFAGGAVGGLCDREGGGEMRRARSSNDGRGEPAETAERIRTEKRDALEAGAQALLEYETLDGHHIEEIVKHGHMTDPPTNPQPPELPPKAEEEDKPKPTEEEKRSRDGDLPGDLAGAPA